MTPARGLFSPLLRRWSPIVLLALLGALSGILSLSSCNGGRARVRRDAAGWWCGAAAGVCTCVEITSVEAPHPACGPSNCCFLQNNGSCTCRYDNAAVDCPALKASLHAARAVDSCPPP